MNIFPSFVVDKRRFYSKNSTHLFLFLPGNQYSKSKNRHRILSSNQIQLLLIGLCIGVTLGIAFVPFLDNECYSVPYFTETERVLRSAPIDPSSSANTSGHYNNMKTDSTVKKSNQFMRRPRFFSTELGLRKKIVCGVILTDVARIENILAINNTLGPQVNQVLYFAVGANWAKKLKSLGLSGVVTLSDKKPFTNISVDSFTHLDKSQYHRAVLKVMRFFGTKLSDSFDYFFIGIDVFYINGRTLMKAVKNISISEDVLWGNVNSKASDKDSSCTVESGFVLSRLLLKNISSRVDRCLSSPSLHFGSNIPKCFQYALGDNAMMCSNEVKGKQYLVASSENLGLMANAVAIGPLSNAKDIYNVHLAISKIRISEIGEETVSLVQKMDEMTPFVPQEFSGQTWPKGYPPPHIPTARFDVLKWKFFSSNAIYPLNELYSEAKLDGIEELDLSSVVNSSIRYLQRMNLNDTMIASNANEAVNSSVPHELYFEYGYRRFDETRGMEYILQFKDYNGNSQSVQCLRPLTKIEVVPMPFVTENRRLSIVVPITLDQFHETEVFLSNFFDISTNKKTNCVLILAIIVRDSLLDIQTMSKLHKLKQLILEMNYNHNKKESINPTNATVVISSTEVLKVAYIIVSMNMKQSKTSNYAMAISDALFSRILQNPNNLVLLAEKFVPFKDDFLNRVRMNTILNHQVYSPIPFVQYDPRLSKSRDQEEVEIRKETGYWAEKSFDFVSFCIGDYASARKKMNSTALRQLVSLPNKGVAILTTIFLQSSPVHILRSQEPSLKIPFDSNIYSNCSVTKNCFNYQWGSKSQLARLILNSEAGT